MTDAFKSYSSMSLAVSIAAPTVVVPSNPVSIALCSCSALFTVSFFISLYVDPSLSFSLFCCCPADRPQFGFACAGPGQTGQCPCYASLLAGVLAAHFLLSFLVCLLGAGLSAATESDHSQHHFQAPITHQIGRKTRGWFLPPYLVIACFCAWLLFPSSFGSVDELCHCVAVRRLCWTRRRKRCVMIASKSPSQKYRSVIPLACLCCAFRLFLLVHDPFSCFRVPYRLMAGFLGFARAHVEKIRRPR